MKTTTLSLAAIAAALAIAGLGVSSAHAAGASFTSGGYTADFSLINGNTQMELVLTNATTGNKQGATISGLDFAVSGFTLGALTSATATDGLVTAANSTPTNLGISILTGDPAGRWHSAAGPAGDPNELTALGGGQPDHLIVGPSYDSGIASQFDPFVDQVGTYIYSVSDVTDPMWGDSNGQVIFRLGTGPDTTTGGDCLEGDCTGSIPEPASLSLLGLGAAGLLLRRRKA